MYDRQHPMDTCQWYFLLVNCVVQCIAIEVYVYVSFRYFIFVMEVPGFLACNTAVKCYQPLQLDIFGCGTKENTVLPFSQTGRYSKMLSTFTVRYFGCGTKENTVLPFRQTGNLKLLWSEPFIPMNIKLLIIQLYSSKIKCRNG